MKSRKKTAASPMKPARKSQFVAKETGKVVQEEKLRIRVLIADDHSILRQGLVSLIEDRADMTVAGEASNGREAVELWKKHRPDVTLLDLRMPELDGVDTIK